MVDKDFFELEVSYGSTLAPSHQEYFKDRFYLFLREQKGTLEIEDKGYTLSEEAIDEIKNFIIENEKTLKSFLEKKKNLKKAVAHFYWQLSAKKFILCQVL